MESNRKRFVLSLNGGSSSVKFALYEDAEPLAKLASGTLDRIGTKGATLTIKGPDGNIQKEQTSDAGDVHDAAGQIFDELEALPQFSGLTAVGHRIVHGMNHTEPEKITPDLLAELRRITPYDPDHLPTEIKLIEAADKRYPKIPQVACFDTAFHRTMPRVAKLLPIPRKYDAKGVQRYGFHGLSYAFLMEELAKLGDPAAKKGKVILAHLGSGASMAAVLDGHSVDTSMGFTPTGGLVMATRTGDLDPGILSFLARTDGMTPTQFQDMVNHKSGLLGISEISSDVRDLLEQESTDVRAKEAIDVFCYQAKKWIGAFASALGGLDTLVFAGGIGENSAVVRERICADLGFLGIDICETLNNQNQSLISRVDAKVSIRVIRTDEELMIARSVIRLL